MRNDYPREIPLHLALTEVGAGWAPLVRRAYAALPADLIIVQVKEKWGLLRIYSESIVDGEPTASPTTLAFRETLWALERESGEICEVCGRPGKLVGDAWFRTRCDACVG